MTENEKDLYWQLLRTLESKIKKDDVLDLILIDSAYKVWNESTGSNLQPDNPVKSFGKV